MIGQYIAIKDIKKKIAGLEYAILSPLDTLNLSEVRLKNSTIYKEAQIVEFGPLDLRMGQNHKSYDCMACSVTPKTDCPGHFGSINLELPIYHLGFFRHTILSLNCLCLTCGSLRLNPNDRQPYRDKMMSAMMRKNYLKVQELFKKFVLDSKKEKICTNCGNGFEGIIKKLEKVAGKIIHSIKDAVPQEINPLYAHYLFSKVRKEDQICFGINPFKNELTDIITTIMPAPPNIIRPTVVLTNAMTGEDDLTSKLKNILFLNQQIINSMNNGDQGQKIQKSQYLMQSHYFHYFNGDVLGLPTQEMDGKLNIRGFYQRLKGKQGRFRQNLSGKRADFNGRTVISPDPNLAIDQVTIPMFMARILTIPELVNQHNIEQLRLLVINGPQNYPGANYLITEHLSKDLGYGNRRLTAKHLKMGDIVERHLQNEDIVLFNRQPSLHRISIMAMRAKVDKWHTLRFNECACTPFNADFDGDEMNIHLPQTLEARAEAKEIMGIVQNLRTIKSGESLVSLLQDFLTTAWLITNKDVFYSRSNFMQFCAAFSDAQEFIELPPPAILRPKELWTGKQVINALLTPNRKARIILNLEMKESNSKTGDCMDPKDGYVIFRRSQLICGNIGKKVLGSSKTGMFYALNRDNSPDVSAEVMQRFSKLSSRWISHYGMTIGIGDVTPDEQLIKNINKYILESYQSCDIDIEQYDRQALEAKPGMSIEQTLESLIKKKLSDVRESIGTDCQSHLKTDNKVLTMFLCGAKGSNINMSQMIGCVGQQVVSGHRVPDGFTDRTLPHFLKNDRHPRAKGFVRNSFYTGMDAIEFFFHTMGGREGLIDTAVKTADTGYLQRKLIKMLEDLHIAYDLTVRSCDSKEIVQFKYGEDGLDPTLVEDLEEPIKLNLIYLNSKTVIKQTNLLPQCDIMPTLESILLELEDKYRSFLTNVRDTFTRARDRVIVFFRNLQGGISHIQLKWFCKCWMERLLNLFMPPGTSVGPIASQSIGEPATQMTLKTFHFAGVASMNVTLGVPRIKEILNASKQIKTPIIRIKLKKEICMDDQAARKVLIEIENTLLGQILKEIEEVYSINGCYLQLCVDWKAINKLMLNITAEDIKVAILNTPKLKLQPEQIQCDRHNIRIQFDLNPKNKRKSNNILFLIQEIKNKIMHVHLKGLENIRQVVITKLEKDQDNDRKDERLIYAEGYGLKQILGIEGVDFKHTKTNHIIEVEKLLGIEAARQSIIEEIVNTMKSHGILLDVRHILLAAETMTFRGRILGFTRFGVDKLKNSTLMLASFEKTMEILFDAAIQGKQDSLNGVSQRIITGQNVPLGTGMFDLMWGQDKRICKFKKEKFLFQ